MPRRTALMISSRQRSMVLARARTSGMWSWSAHQLKKSYRAVRTSAGVGGWPVKVTRSRIRSRSFSFAIQARAICWGVGVPFEGG
jgi:hypothetical protein